MKKFLTSLLIALIFVASTAAMLSADAVSRGIGGDAERSIFSYRIKSEQYAALELFGQSYTLSREPLRVISDAAAALGGFFSDCAPATVRLYAQALKNGVSELYSTLTRGEFSFFPSYTPQTPENSVSA